MLGRTVKGWFVVLTAFMMGPLAYAQEQGARLTFDVASIRPSSPGTVNGGIKATPGGHGYTAQFVTVKLMISLMYKVPMRQIVGGPAWLEDERFDVEARADHSYNLDDLHTMYQNLLADRFGLKFHKGSRQAPMYALTVEPSGLKMKPNTSPQDYKIPINGFAPHVTATRMPMSYFCWWLGQMLQSDERPVVNKTGLDGNYDWEMTFAPPVPVGSEPLPPELRDLPSIFTALKEQLGLKLTAEKGPVEFYVIDHIEKPTEN